MTSIQSNTENDYNTTTIQMGFKRKSNDLFESVSQEFSLLYEPRSDKRDLLAIKVKSEIFTEKERPSCCEQLQKILSDFLYK